MRRHAVAAAVAAACILAPCAAIAQAMTKAEAVTLQRWGERVQAELDKRLVYPTLIGGQPYATGVVRVKFNCSESGRPDKVTLLKTSGSGALDRAAIKAVSSIATLHPLPEGLTHDQQYVAVLLFETDRERHDQRLREIRSDTAKSNAWFKGPAVTQLGTGTILLAAR